MTAETLSVCRHGALRRTCETCDLADDCERLERDLTAARARVAELERNLAEFVRMADDDSLTSRDDPADLRCAVGAARALLTPSPEPQP